MGGPPPGGAPPTPGGVPPAGGGNPFQGLDPNDPVARPQALLRSVALSIQQAFPGKKWKPEEFAATADNILQHYQQVDPIDKQIAQLYLQGLKQGTNQQNADTRAQHDANIDTNTANRNTETQSRDQEAHADRLAALKERLQGVGMQQAGADRRTAVQAGAKLAAENIIQAGANGREQAVLDAKSAAQDAGLDEKEWETQVKSVLAQEGMDANFSAKLFAANPTGAAPKAPLKQPLPAAPKRGGAKPAGSGQAASSPPVSALKEGIHTKFANGQTWTLQNGKPVQIGG